jgi:hypothetical protein
MLLLGGSTLPSLLLSLLLLSLLLVSVLLLRTPKEGSNRAALPLLLLQGPHAETLS